MSEQKLRLKKEKVMVLLLTAKLTFEVEIVEVLG